MANMTGRRLCHEADARTLAAMKKVEKRPIFFREWREYRGLSQERVAERMEVSQDYLSRMERGERRYNQHFLEALAWALNCEPADLIMRNPLNNDAIWSIWEQIPPESRPQALKVLEAFRKAS